MLTEHQVLLFWTQLFVLLITARALGTWMRRIGQPPVVGELTAGLLLGPSILGYLSPQVFRWLFPEDPVQQGILAAIAWLGVMLLLIATGFETDLGLLRRMGRATTRVAITSLVVPALFGLAVGWSMPDRFIGEGSPRSVFALFLATALSISALPVIAAVLSQLGLMRRSISQLMLAVAMINDVIGWVMLGVVASLAQSGRFELVPLLVAVIGLVVFLGAAFTIGQRTVDALLRKVREHKAGTSGAFSVTLLVALAAGCATQALGLEAVLGAFIAGTILGRSKFQDDETFQLLERITTSFLAPIFFATAGLRVNLAVLADPQVALWGGVVLAAASLSKLGGAYCGAWLAGLPVRERWALGAGLNARGAVEIVLATVGLSLGVLSDASYALIVLMAMATTMAAPPFLRLALLNWQGSAEEQERLEREDLLGGNVLVRAKRVLLPSHGGPNSLLAAQIIHLAWPRESEVTLLSVGSNVPPEDLAKVRSVFGDRPVVHEHEPHAQPFDAILKHAALGYGALALGATDARVAASMGHRLIDDLLGASPLPVIMVRRDLRQRGDKVPTYQRILVPATGTAPGHAAQEVACSIAKQTGGLVTIAHVVTSPSRTPVRVTHFWSRRGAVPENPKATDAAHKIIEDARVFATRMGVQVETVVCTGASAAKEILTLVRRRDIDLLVVGANLRQLSGRPFLGHGVEEVLEQSDVTTVVVTAPPGGLR